VEIFSHGGLLVPAEVLSALMAAGARLAGPGEFTRRALLNGKLDLLQAEAIGDLIDATAPEQRRAAIDQYDRGLSKRLEKLRELVLELDALVCYEIDFPEEDDGPVPAERIQAAIDTLVNAFEALLSTAHEGERLREGALAVIAGRPNSGKSALFNALLGRERAIVTEIPGTTRDAIEAPVTCDGFPFRLIDTAGLRQTDDRIESLGIEVSKKYLGDADVVLFCVEAGHPLDDEEEEFWTSLDCPKILVSTKGDLHSGAPVVPGLLVSSETGRGVAGLRTALAELAFVALASRARIEPLITRERHRLALRSALDEVRAFDAARASGLESAVSAVHLRAAVGALESVIGVVSTDDVLQQVFSSFCVGK
jgi:tRNA modification GTPase